MLTVFVQSKWVGFIFQASSTHGTQVIRIGCGERNKQLGEQQHKLSLEPRWMTRAGVPDVTCNSFIATLCLPSSWPGVSKPRAVYDQNSTILSCNVYWCFGQAVFRNLLSCITAATAVTVLYMQAVLPLQLKHRAECHAKGKSTTWRAAALTKFSSS